MVRVVAVVFLPILTGGLLLLAAADVHAQASGSIAGRVTMPTGEPAHRASVLLAPLGRVTETGEDGGYVFEGILAGTYDVLTYQTPLDSETVSVEVPPGGSVIVDLTLRLSPVRTEITVTARGREESTFDVIPSVTSLDSFALSETMAPSLGDVLDNQPGVAKRSFGAGNSRPVLRGFDGDRVLVMQDGVRGGSLASQSGDHGEPIDASNLERIEVLKGPATLLYGSNAVGGVVNAISTHQDFHEAPHAGWVGQISSSIGSANAQGGASFNLNYGAAPWQLWVGGGGQRTGDYQTPQGEVPNSKSRITNGSFGLGWFGDGSFISAGYQGNEGRYGVPFASAFEGLDALDIAYRQHSLRFAGGITDFAMPFESARFSFSYSDWNHDELEILGTDVEVGTTFENKDYAYRAAFTQAPTGPLSGSWGVEGRRRDYDVTGEEALTPPVVQDTFAAFAVEELDFEAIQLQIGGRIEHNGYQPEAGSGLAPRSFTGVSAGVGARVDLWRGGAFVASYTDSFRSPALEELYNNGPHVGNLTFEIGNPNLRRERSHGFDVALRQQDERLRGEINFFYYGIDDFVFLAPTGATVDGLIEADYAQGNARFLGLEGQIGIILNPYLSVNLGLDAVDAELTASSVSLPRIPPMRGRIGVDVHYGNLSIEPEIVLADRREDIFQTETSTAGYGLANLRASYTLPDAHITHHFSVEIFNIGDRLYRNHLSFIKDLAPEIGRGIRFGYAAKLF